MKGTKTGQKEKKLIGIAQEIRDEDNEFTSGKVVTYKGKAVKIKDRFQINSREFIEFIHSDVKGSSVVPLSMFIRGILKK